MTQTAHRPALNGVDVPALFATLDDTSTSDARRSLLGWIPSWLRPGRSSLPGHLPRSAAKGRPVVLRDGSKVLIRQVQRADAPLLADGFARLSARSRQMRFLTAKKELTPAELRYFTEVNHHDHEALGALDPANGRGVGVARYVRDAEDPQAAEIAVTIVDDWQGRGLATALVSADNAAIAALLRNTNAELVGRGAGTVEYQVTLAPGEKHDHASRSSAATTSGQPLGKEAR